MKIGFYTSKRFLDSKRQAVEEVIKKLGIEAEVVIDESSNAPSTTSQFFGFEELFKKTKIFANEALKNSTADVGIGIASGLSFIYAAHEWYYFICIALQNKDGISTASFTPGISVPEWMIKEVQDKDVKLDAIVERIASEEDPVVYFSGKTLTRKDLMVPTLILAFSKLGSTSKISPPAI
jgi:non-canonical (house-cleaning) NTP pyrophosphatase